jgi:PAS domain S-box-containing protein
MISTHFSAPHRPSERELRFVDLLARQAADYLERKRTAEALQASEERFEMLANGSPVLLWVNGLEGCEFVNREYLQFLGLESDLQVRGYDWSSFVHPDDWEAYLAAYFEAFEAAASFGAEFRFRRHDGQYRWMRSEGTPRRGADGSLLGYVGASIDITERKKAEQALRASEESSRMLVSVLTDVPWTMDEEGRFTMPQLAWTAYTGQCWEASRDLGWLKALHPDDRDQISTIWKRAGEPRSLYRAHGRLWHAPSSQYRHFEARATPLFHPDGSVREWVGAFTDIEDQKRLESELRESDRHKDEFIAMLAHELRNPLAPIRNSLALLRLGGADSTTTKTAAAIIERQVSQMVRLLDDLLDLNRVSKGKIHLKLEKLELGSVLKEALEAVRPACDVKDLDLSIKLPAEPIYVSGDSTRLAQVVGNLLNNACKFTEPGGRIGVAVDTADSQAVIRIYDSGIGLAVDQLDRIFNLFTQVDTSLERSQSGLGIGLTLVKSLVEMHGGTVEAHSAGLGEGSEFVVHLPKLSQVAQPLQSELESTLSKRVTGRRILVVDDNQDSADSLALLLKLAGHETHTAYDGLLALEEADRIRPEVILLDIGLPELNGYEVAHTLREKTWGKNILLLALTGWGQPENRRRTQESGFDGHLVKPVEVASLMEIVGSLSRQEQRQAAKPG